MVYSVRFSNEEQCAIEQYSMITGRSISEIIRSAVMEKIEDEMDIEICRKALDECKKNPKTLTHEEMKKELNLL